MSRYCLDTSAYIYFQKGDPQVVELVESAEWIAIPSMVIGELASGFLQGTKAKQNFKLLSEFLANPVVTEVSVDHDVALIFGEILVELRSRGTPLPTNDTWIAATCARAGATLLTYDAHFHSIGRIGSLVLTPS
ncbi:MAG: type II toxin-antitoxin system VapC family toxin [Acidobacteria bacterium]|nr:type II toxin-antitoxin system VapC family toxin [Acidobacteriota bacterium]